MCRKIEILLITSTLILAVHSDHVLKCYMCTSLSNEGCDSAMTATSLEPVECTGGNLMNWQRNIQQHNVLHKIAKIFDADIPQDYRSTHHDLACAKVTLNVENQEVKNPVIIRTCQTAKTEIIDPCKTMEQKLKETSSGQMEQCSLCPKDACNGSTVLSSEIFYILLTLLGTLIRAAFYPLA